MAAADVKAGAGGKATQTVETKTVPEDFEWLQYQDPSSDRGKIANAIVHNPFVAAGAIATVLALGMGIANMFRRNSKKQQFYMRARVGAQGFTIASVIAGMFYHAKMGQ